MRWKFIFDENDPDYAKKQATKSLIKSWWEFFEKNSDGLKINSEPTSSQDLQKLADMISEHLHIIHEQLMWERIRVDDNKHVFVITSEENMTLRALANSILEAAPQIDGWTFEGYRPPEDLEVLEQAFEARMQTRPPTEVSIELKRAVDNRIEMNLKSPDFSGKNREQDMVNAMFLGMIALGEENFEKWMGMTTTEGPGGTGIIAGFMKFFNKDGPSRIETDAITLGNLHNHFIAMKEEILSSLPDKPIFETFDPDNAQWSIMALQAKNPDAAFELPERLTYVTPMPELTNAINNSSWFNSECLSRCGETFCYIKSVLNKDDPRIEPLDALIDELDKGLRDSKLGCHIYSGKGLSHVFIDLALTDVEKATELIREVLAKYEYPEESWLLFYDACYADEWIGILPTTPPPPTAEK